MNAPHTPTSGAAAADSPHANREHAARQLVFVRIKLPIDGHARVDGRHAGQHARERFGLEQRAEGRVARDARDAALERVVEANRVACRKRARDGYDRVDMST